jgi:recombinational DNA repair protein (RecF pathway)
MENKTEIYGYEIELHKCSVCGKHTHVSAFSAKSEKKAVTILIRFMKEHLNVCESYRGQKVELVVKLNQKTRKIEPRLIIYGTKTVDRKIII